MDRHGCQTYGFPSVRFDPEAADACVVASPENPVPPWYEIAAPRRSQRARRAVLFDAVRAAYYAAGWCALGDAVAKEGH